MMRFLPVFGIIVGLGFGAEGGFAQEEVTFQSTPIQPSVLKIRKAQAKGIELQPDDGIELKGVRFNPEGAGPNPAVILLVSGDGLTQSHLNWAQTLSEAGYKALVVDSFGSRGGTDYRDTPAMNMPDDAYSAFRYLAAQPDVDDTRISLLGFSLGGSHLFTTISAENPRVPPEFAPQSAIAVYPVCPADGSVTVPMMLLAGDADKLISLATCRGFVQRAQANNSPVTLHEYSAVTHFFDNPAYAKSGDTHASKPQSMWFQDNHYDAEAHADAVSRVLRFLKDGNL